MVNETRQGDKGDPGAQIKRGFDWRWIETWLGMWGGGLKIVIY